MIVNRCSITRNRRCASPRSLRIQTDRKKGSFVIALAHLSELDCNAIIWDGVYAFAYVRYMRKLYVMGNLNKNS